jgi:nickel transport system substrate-binding protein
MKKFLSLLLTGAMSAMLLAGCGTTANDPDPASSSTPPAGEEERSITIAQSANFSMGFTPGVQSYEATYYMNNFYEGLVEYRDGEYLPCLATDWAASDDGLTYTFHLRDDVQFNDGTAFNAEAVKLYFDNMKSVIGTSANYGQLDMLTTEITVDDEYTVSFHLSRPYYNVLNDLSMVMPRGILSAAAFHEDGSLNTEYLMTHTPGTGPYMFESVNETATEYTFVKNPNYWGEEPDVDRFTVKVIPESKVAAMRAGEVDFIMGSDTLDANSYLELSQVEGITGVISDFDFVTEFIALNDEVAPLDDLNVRTAIQMAIDKESIAQNIYSGLRTKADSVMPADMPYCTATVSTPDYDMDGAIALLEDSGWVDSNGDGIREKDGTVLSFTITYPSTGVYDNMVLFFQSSMAELGIEINTNPIDLMAFMQQVFMEDNYEMTAYMSYWFPYDPYTFVANMYPSTDYADPSGIYSTDPQVAKALATMSDEEAKELIGGLYNTDDPVVVQEIYTAALDSANESSVVIPLNYRNEYAVFNNEVIESYTFNSIPNHVDVAAIHLK